MENLAGSELINNQSHQQSIPPPSMYNNNPDQQHRVQDIRKIYSHSDPGPILSLPLAFIVWKTIYKSDGVNLWTALSK